MSTLLKVRASPMPQSWKDAIKEARRKNVPEVAVQLIAAAAAPKHIESAGWTYAAAVAALGIIEGLARSGSRCRRLRGLIMRLAPAKPAKVPKHEEWFLVGGTLASLTIQRRIGGRRVRASGTRAEMEALLMEAKRRWAKLPGGREIEALETERIERLPK